MDEGRASQGFGLKDQPIEKFEQESLGLGEYAEVLTEFIQGCDTPLTIALQGDWGSGKTSLMRLIRDALINRSEKQRYFTVWFNTWQYSQFNMSETLALSMISKITDELVDNQNAVRAHKVKQAIKTTARMAVIGGASFVGQADLVKEVWGIGEQGASKSSSNDAARALEAIKSELAKIVGERTTGPVEKIVVFIDDLDRLIPEKAVELLEAMKVFLDIDKCVFIIACDYSVVTAGLKAKFGIAEGELKGKSFFDKIIQVPFKMPTRRYQVDQYIHRLLDQIGMDFDKTKDIDTYRDLVEQSVGFNPRTMKRLLNTLQLLMILEDKRRVRREEDSLSNDLDDNRRRHACRVTFGILCMLESYEAIYDFITRNLEPSQITSLRDGLATNEQYDDLRHRIQEQAGEEGLENAIEFIRTFVDCLQLDDEEELSTDEVNHF
ncbi:MAG: P-loop NTPase fold protein [Gammaproteobacteria bacterium]|nr:P-loop NTPase fold protein [Gammaproteobacteria bacterium]